MPRRMDTNASHASSDRFYGVSPVFHNYNGTHQYEDMQFTAGVSGTVGVSLSASAEIDASAIVAGARVTTSATLFTYLTTSITDSTTVKNVPPGTNVYAQDGVFTNVSYGHYVYYWSNCTMTDYGYVYAYVPDGIGWYTHN